MSLNKILFPYLFLSLFLVFFYRFGPLPLSLFVCLFFYLSFRVLYIIFVKLFPKVIGDKKGGDTALALSRLGSLSVLHEIKQVVQVPMKFIHVHRNPFDNIATMTLRAAKSRDAVRKEGVKVSRWLIWSIFFTLVIGIMSSVV